MNDTQKKTLAAAALKGLKSTGQRTADVAKDKGKYDANKCGETPGCLGYTS